MLDLVQKWGKTGLKQNLVSRGLRWNQAIMEGGYEDELVRKYSVKSWPSVILVGTDGKAIKWAVERVLKGESTKSGK
jgi:hypothetical protein